MYVKQQLLQYAVLHYFIGHYFMIDPNSNSHFISTALNFENSYISEGEMKNILFLNLISDGQNFVGPNFEQYF